MAWTEQHALPFTDPDGVAISPNNQWAAAGSDSSDVVVAWDLGTGSEVLRLSGLDGRAFKNSGFVTFSPDSSILTFAHQFIDTDAVELSHYDTSTWTRLGNATITTVAGSSGIYCQFDYSPDGRYFAHINALSDELEVREVAGDTAWTTVASVPISNTNYRGLTWGPNGHILAADTVGTYYVIETGTWTVTDTGTLPTTGVYQVESQETGALFICSGNAAGDPVILVELDGTGNVVVVDQFTDTSSTESAAAAEITDHHIYYTRQTEAAEMIRQTDRPTWTQETTLPVQGAVRRADFSPDATLLAIGDRGGDAIRIYDTGVTTTTPVSGVAQLDDGTLLTGAKITGINDTDGRTAGTATTDASGAYSIDFQIGDEGHFLFEYDDGTTQHTAKSKPFVAVQ